MLSADELATATGAPLLVTSEARAHLEAQPTTWDSQVVVWVRRSDANSTFELATAFIGKLAPLEPWDPRLASQAEFERALAFWSRSALVHDPQIMEPVFTSSWSEILRQSESTYV